MSDTPDTEARKMKMLSSLQSGVDEVVLAEFAGDLERERNQLRAWKAEMMLVTPPMQEIAREIGLTIGESTHDKILPELIRRREVIEGLTTPRQN